MTIPLIVAVADGHRSTISAEFLTIRDRRETPSLRFGRTEYDIAVSSSNLCTDNTLERDIGRPT